jgi:hypothetical protein
MTYQLVSHVPAGTLYWLAQPHIASISSKFHGPSHAGTIMEVWSELLLQWLDAPRGLHPSTGASDIWTYPQTPLLPNLLKKGAS